MNNLIRFFILGVSVIVFCYFSLIALQSKRLAIKKTNLTNENIKCNFIVKNQRDSLKFLILLLFSVFFAYFCGNREMNTPDTTAYFNYFINIQNTRFFNINGQYGFLFEYFTKIISLISPYSFSFWLFSIVIFNFFIVTYIFIKFKNIDFFKAYFLYFVLFGLYYNYIVLRQGMAITLLIVAFYHSTEKRNAKALVFILLATLFHESSIIALLYFLPRVVNMILKNRKEYLFMSCLVLLYFIKITDNFLVYVVEFITQNNILPQSFGKYILYVDDLTIYDISFWHLFLFFGYCYLIYFKYIKTNEQYYFFSVNKIGLIIIACFSRIIVITRLVDYFNLSLIFLLSQKEVLGNKLMYKVLYFVFIVLAFIYNYRIAF